MNSVLFLMWWCLFSFPCEAECCGSSQAAGQTHDPPLRKVFLYVYALLFGGNFCAFSVIFEDIMGFPSPHNNLMFVSLKINQNKEPHWSESAHMPCWRFTTGKFQLPPEKRCWDRKLQYLTTKLSSNSNNRLKTLIVINAPGTNHNHEHDSKTDFCMILFQIHLESDPWQTDCWFLLQQDDDIIALCYTWW